MRNNHANQRVARDVAEDRGQFDSGYCSRARDLRAENARRVAAAQARKAETGLVWLARDVMSTPYAEVRA